MRQDNERAMPTPPRGVVRWLGSGVLWTAIQILWIFELSAHFVDRTTQQRYNEVNENGIRPTL